MKQSEQIGELAASLAKAQAELRVTRDSTNPFFKSKYASLEACWDAARGALSANGLALVQGHDVVDEVTSSIILVTILVHSSGQWIKSRTPLILKDNTMQSLGGATTYAKRYALCAMVGLAEHDDDGNSVSRHEQKALPSKAAPAPSPTVAPARAPIQTKMAISPTSLNAPSKFQGGWQARQNRDNIPQPPPDNEPPPYGDLK